MDRSTRGGASGPDPCGLRTEALVTEGGSPTFVGARSLRTQQRAWAAPPPPTSFLLQAAVLEMRHEVTAYWSVFHP